MAACKSIQGQRARLVNIVYDSGCDAYSKVRILVNVAAHVAAATTDEMSRFVVCPRVADVTRAVKPIVASSLLIAPNASSFLDAKLRRLK